MKKTAILFAILMVLMVCLTACGNYALLDSSWKFDRALIELPGGEVIEVQVDSWTDADDGEQITIKSADGKVYLTSSYNCVMIKDE